MRVAGRIGRLGGNFLIGLTSSLAGFIFTVYYLKLMWSFGDPRWGLPFLWFIPHGIKGLHFHHDIEFFIAAPAAAFLARRGVISRTAAFAAASFFFGMAMHHWLTEGIAIVSMER